MPRVRSIMAVATVIAAGTLIGAGVAQAAPHVLLTPGSYQSGRPRRRRAGAGTTGAGKGVFGERADATAVGHAVVHRVPGQRARRLVSATYYFYGPGPASTTWRAARFLLVRQRQRPVHQLAQGLLGSQYGSTPPGRQRRPGSGLYKICEDHYLASDPCSTTSILTTSY